MSKKWGSLQRLVIPKSLNLIYEIFDIAFPLGEKAKESQEDQQGKEFNLEEKIDILERIFNYDGSNGPLPKQYSKAKEKLNSSLVEELKLFLKFIQSLHKVPLKELLEDKSKSLLFGSLSLKDELDNAVATLSVEFKKIDDDTVKRVFNDTFSNLCLLDEQYSAIFSAIGFREWSLGKVSKRGGAIFVDYGGTGKSLSKSSIKNFATLLAKSVETKCEIKEVTSGEISSYVNSGPQTVQRWYLGSKVSDVISGKQSNLVEKARENRFPSFLIVDEAKDLIKDESQRKIGESSKETVESFKRFIQDLEKGGVTGFVITILIANMRPEEIDGPLSQGGERLKPIWFGHPQKPELWSAVAKYHITNNNLDFGLKLEELPLENIGKVLLKQQEYLRTILLNLDSHKEHLEEAGGISQREFAELTSEFKNRSSDSRDSVIGFDILKFRNTEEIKKVFFFAQFLEFLIEKAIEKAQRLVPNISKDELRALLKDEIDLGKPKKDTKPRAILQNDDTQLREMHNKITNAKKNNESYAVFFQTKDKTLITQKIQQWVIMFHPNNYLSKGKEEQNRLASFITTELNGCLSNINRGEFNADSPAFY